MKTAATIFCVIALLSCAVLIIGGAYEIHPGLGKIVGSVFTAWLAIGALMVMHD